MSSAIPSTILEKFTTFGDLLRYLRRRIGITQMELSIAVGYSDAQISRLEQNLRLPDIPTIQARFIPALDLENEPEAMTRLLELAANVRREDAPASGLCPYKGLNYFDEEDADLFVGREELTRKLTERVLTMTGNKALQEMRFLAVVGASGSGKSSLVRAGVVPALRWDKKSADWHIHTLTPTTHPLESLAMSIFEENESVLAAATLMDDLAIDPRSLHLFATRKLTEEKNTSLLLIIDQFEELFTLCRSEEQRVSFINNLLTASSAAGGSVIVLITLRADFYAHCANYIDLREALAINQEYIGAMSILELQRVIEEPAQRGRWELEPGLVDLLLYDVGNEPGALPLLSHALLETWQRRRGRTLTLSGYTSSGGVHGAIAETAEAVYTDQLTKEQQSIARRIFLRLTELGDETFATDTRRRATFSELIIKQEDASSTKKVLQKLADARLIITSEDTAEVVHEALIREWPTLRRWLEDNREDLRLHRQLTEAAQEWEAMDNLPDILYRGIRLEQARQWASSHEDEINTLEREFLKTSLEVSDNHAAEREAQRQRELEAARRLAEMESQRAKEQAQAAHQLQKRAIFLTISFVIALFMAVTALFLGAQARQAAVQARNIALVAGSQAALSNQDTDAAIALAWQAVALNPDSALAQAQLSEAAYAPGTVRILKGNKDIVTWIAISPDDKTVLAGADDGSVILWELATGQLLWEQQVHTQTGERWVQDVAFSPDGQVVAATYDDCIMFWRAANGQLIRQIDSFVNRQKIAFNPTGDQFATIGSEEQSHLNIWDSASGKVLREYEFGSYIEDLVYSTDGSAILIASQTGLLTLIDTQTGQDIREFQEYLGTNAGRLHYIALSPDGAKVIAASYGTELLPIWDFETGELVKNYSYAGVMASAFHPRDNTVLIGDFSVLRTIDLQTGAILRNNTGHSRGILNLAITSDGSRAVTSGVDGILRVWDLQGGQVVRRFNGSQVGLGDVSLSPDGRSILVGSIDGTVTLWNLETGEEIHRFVDDQPINAVTFSPDGRKALIGAGHFIEGEAKSGHIILWDVETGEELRRFKGQPYTVKAVAFSPDGRLALSAGNGAMIILWDVETGAEIRRYEDYWVNSPWDIETYYDIEFSPDGKRIFASHTSQVFESHTRGIIIGWDIESGEEVQQLTGHREVALGIMVNKDGKRLVSGGTDSQIILWDLQTGSILRRIATHSGGTGRVQFSPDETLLLGGSLNGTNSLWRVDTGEEIRRYATGFVKSPYFTPDGRHAVAGYQDGWVELWRIDATLDDLLTWVRNNRYVPELTCEQRELYRIEPLCNQN
jgi:WD40 repeat protein/transcriptional regulator with XRE-family HTH domain